jgi:3',5'-cyclic-AMP phosphodiesterase
MSRKFPITRRAALECLAWGGTGLLWTMKGGVPQARLIEEAAAAPAGFSFVQISDTHIGFSKPANPDPAATFTRALGKITALERKPAFLLHTGDLTQLSKPKEFDDFDELAKGARLDLHCTPGEHDVLDEKNGQAFLDRYGKFTLGRGWRSFDHGGVHFIGLVNVLDLKAGGMGALGSEQLAWLADDLKGRSASTPIVLFAHIPLWAAAPEWGWGTQDAAEALKLLARFGAVTVLNGHVHQIMQKIEGNVTFHTARSTAFPQPTPGSAPAPGPKLVPPDERLGALGVTRASVVKGKHPLAIVDETLAN